MANFYFISEMDILKSNGSEFLWIKLMQIVMYHRFFPVLEMNFPKIYLAYKAK